MTVRKVTDAKHNVLVEIDPQKIGCVYVIPVHERENMYDANCMLIGEIEGIERMLYVRETLKELFGKPDPQGKLL